MYPATAVRGGMLRLGLTVIGLTPLAASCTGSIDAPGERAGAGAGGTGDGVTVSRPPTSSGVPDPASPPGPPPSSPGTVVAGGAAPRPLPVARRLTRDEYGHTVRDVLGVDVGVALDALTDDRALEGFVNVASAQTVGPERALAYGRLGQLVASKLDVAGFATKNGVCVTPTRSCQSAFVARMGLSLFRRPLRTEETATFEKLFDDVLATGADFSRGARAVTEAMLSSPHFLYRLETERTGTPGARALNGHEMATRMSYLLWASAPDDALMQAAAAGTLATARGRQEQVARMLRDGRGRRVTERFIRDWMRTDDLPATAQPQVAALVAFHQRHVWTERAPLAELYTTTKGEPGRTGLLGQPAVVMSMSSDGPGNIIMRGLFLESRVFCRQPTHDPPESIRGAIAEATKSAPARASDREISELRLGRPECAFCHRAFDPLAFGFEVFDISGRKRAADEHGNAIRPDGWIPDEVLGQRVAYRNVDEYMAILGRDPIVARCIAQKHLEFALGTALTPEHEPWAESLRRDYTEAGGGYEAMVAALVKHELFTTVVTQ